MMKTRSAMVAMMMVSLVVIVGVALQAPIAQDLAYHQFSDVRTLLYVPNFWNVMSNLPFLLVGGMGCYWALNTRSVGCQPAMKWAYVVFFAGVAAVALGSAYYHLSPDNNTLVWDRLPMTIAFMALFSIIVSEYISLRGGRMLLLPLLVAGIASVCYWHYTEARGMGDLRPYALVQFLPMLLIPLILLMFKPAFTSGWGYWLLMLGYVLAKILEHFDAGVYAVLSFLSGHSLKHVAAALGVYGLLKAYQVREPVNPA